MRRFDAQIGPESTSCMTIRMASPSMDVCRLGASKSSKLGPVNEAMGAGMVAASPVGNAPRFCKAAMSGLKKNGVMRRGGGRREGVEESVNTSCVAI